MSSEFDDFISYQPRPMRLLAVILVGVLAGAAVVAVVVF